MIVRLYCDVPTYATWPNAYISATNQPGSQPPDGCVRVAIDVDLPIRHHDTAIRAVAKLEEGSQ